MSTSPIDRTLECNGLSIHFVEWGEPSNPTVLIHHGFLDQCRAWDRVASELASKWHLVIPDARGHGDSAWIGPGGTYYFPDYILDLRTLHTHLGLEPMALVGHSMGGSVVSYYAGAYPSATWAVVLVEGLGPPDMPAAHTPALLKRFVEGTFRWVDRPQTPLTSGEEAAERMCRWDPKMTPQRAQELVVHAIRREENGPLTWKYDPLHRAPMGMPFSLDRAKSLWQAIEAPVLHVRGAESPFKLPDGDSRLAAFKNIEEVVIPHGGHNIHTHAEQELVLQIDDFLTRAQS